MIGRNPIFAALDLPSPSEAIALVKKISSAVAGFKVGSELFTAAGPDIVREIRALGAMVFLDLKFHDIPNTVHKAVLSAGKLDVQMLTVHTSGGREMMRAAQEAAQTFPKPPVVLGVTVLTSMTGVSLGEIGLPENVGPQVERLARLAMEAGLGGLVCSPLEITTLRQVLPNHIALVTPGIRGGPAPLDDQKRTLSAREAMNLGATWLVIGRPIYAAPEPLKAVRQILSSLEN